MPAPGDYRIYIRQNSTLQRIGEIDIYTKCAFYPRFNDVGAWIIDVPFNASSVPLLVKGNGIVVYRNGVYLMSGDIQDNHTIWNERGSSIEVSGKDDNFALAATLAYPVPTGPPYTAAAYDIRSGTASTVMRAYVNANCGPGAPSPRKWVGMALPADPLLGTAVEGTARFDPLIEKLQELALAGGGLGFRVVHTGTSLYFEVYAPVDRTASAIFSPLLGTLVQYEYTLDAGGGNYVIVAGGGEGTARTFYEKGDSAAIAGYRRIEFFRDRRDTTDLSQMEQTADQELARNADRTSLSIQPADSDSLSFQTHYNLGDRVSVVLVKETPDRVISVDYVYQDIVRELEIILEGSNEVINPVVGTEESRSIALMEFQRQLERRIANLERR